MSHRNPESLMSRVEAFYTRNPDEWLTWDDAAQKFDCTTRQMSDTMRQLRKAGRLRIGVTAVLVVMQEQAA